MVTDPHTHTHTHTDTHPPTHRQTGPITIHCAAASAQCNKDDNHDTRSYTQALRGSPSVIRICAPAAPPIMLRIGTHSLNPIPNPNPIP